MANQPTEAQMNDQLDEAQEGVDGGSRWPGMSYEQGVANTLEWVLGLNETAPMEED